eukprot:TRINITY_DN21923_c0_g1_i1.p1 TRINITY_DN21923_c0_g1~~TRINITY_DN21923_c0_g1_i1.p1  ORF type:complete len:302 (-),score=25.93 TRINITY_DN21923_c0_g1_i1:311-1216(-)
MVGMASVSADKCRVCEGSGKLLEHHVCPLCDGDLLWPRSPRAVANEQCQSTTTTPHQTQSRQPAATNMRRGKVLRPDRFNPLLANANPDRGFREIWAVHDAKFIRVYQAYNDAIADEAVAHNTFRAPLEKGLWSSTRMTWIKPSAVWMAYRCGWTTLKDKNQTRVLALDLARDKFEEMMLKSVHSHGLEKGACKSHPVVYQWDPERVITRNNADKSEKTTTYTRSMDNARSLQIGLRGEAVEMLLDPTVVVRISDMTSRFRDAVALLRAGATDEDAAAALWRDGAETLMDVPDPLRQVLQM